MAEAKKSWTRDDLWENELEALKNILAQTELVETVKWGGPVYTINGKNVLGIGGFKNYFTIWFFKGVFLTDPKKVLVNANEGVTKSLRQWRFASIDEIDEKLILTYVNEAIANEKAGKAIKPEASRGGAELSAAKSKSFEVPEILTSALKEAKQEKTKLTRIEKILPMVKDGIGLNDKYR